MSDLHWPLFGNAKETDELSCFVKYKPGEGIWQIKIDHAISYIIGVRRGEKSFSAIEFRGSRQFRLPGEPNIGGHLFSLALPYRGKIEGEPKITPLASYYSGAFSIDPVLNPYIEGDSKPVPNPDPKIYKATTWFPTNPVEVREPRNIDGLDCVVLAISPISYDPSHLKRLRVQSLHVELTCKVEGNGEYSQGEVDESSPLVTAVVGYKELMEALEQRK